MRIYNKDMQEKDKNSHTHIHKKLGSFINNSLHISRVLRKNLEFL